MADSGPNVFEYDDYRTYLRDHYDWRKQEGYGFSFRAFSRRAGLKSSNYLKLVMDGERNLSTEMAAKFAHGCGLEGTAADYFGDLVDYTQAGTSSERARLQERLGRFRQYRAIHALSLAQAAYHRDWYMPAIRELAAREDFSEDPRWIAARLMPRVSEREIKIAVETLLRLGLLVRDDDDRLHQAEALVTTGPGPLGHQVASYHRAMMERAQGAIDEFSRAEREISSLTLCVSPDMLGELKERIREFRRELLQTAELGGAPTRVVQINFQLFPLTTEPDEEA